MITDLNSAFSLMPYDRGDREPDMVDLLSTPNPAIAVYSKLFAEAGMFTPHDSDKDGHANRTYYISDDVKIHHTGPVLSLFDEETLIAMIQLTNSAFLENEEETQEFMRFYTQRRQKLESRRERLEQSQDSSNKVLPAFSHLDFEATLKGDMSAFMINAYLGVSWGGKARKLRMNSVERLENTVVQFTIGNKVKPLTHLVRIDRIKDQAEFTVIFDLHLHILVGQLINIDLALRNKLTNKGKCLQRLLTVEGFPQRKDPFCISLRDFRAYIGLSKEPLNRIRKELLTPRTKDGVGPLEIMKSSGFIRDYSFIGTGVKNDPFMLRVN